MDLLNYMRGLPSVLLGPLYDSPFTCQAVLRSLPAVAKQYVLRLLYLDVAVPQGALRCVVACHGGKHRAKVSAAACVVGRARNTARSPLAAHKASWPRGSWPTPPRSTVMRWSCWSGYSC